LTEVGAGNREVAIEWRTYTPDGRVLTVRRTEAGWAAACEGTEAERISLVEAIRDVIVGGALPLRRESTLDLWIEETATHIVGDTLH
jgi:hypothetical protein